MAKFDILVNKSDTFNASGLAAAATSGTLSSGSFGSPSGVHVLVVDYDVPAKFEVISATIAGTALTGITRALDGTSDVTHSANAKVAMMMTNTHWTQLRAISASDAWTATTPAVTGFSGTPTANLRYMKFGTTTVCNVNVTGTSNATTEWTIALPFACNATLGTRALVSATDNSAPLTTPALAYIVAGESVIRMNKDNSGAGWTGSGTKAANFQIIYEA